MATDRKKKIYIKKKKRTRNVNNESIEMGSNDEGVKSSVSRVRGMMRTANSKFFFIQPSISGFRYFDENATFVITNQKVEKL